MKAFHNSRIVRYKNPNFGIFMFSGVVAKLHIWSKFLFFGYKFAIIFRRMRSISLKILSNFHFEKQKFILKSEFCNNPYGFGSVFNKVEGSITFKNVSLKI